MSAPIRWIACGIVRGKRQPIAEAIRAAVEAARAAEEEVRNA